MTGDIALLVLYVAVVVGLAWPLAGYMARVYDGRVAALAPVERGFYRLAGIDPARGQRWTAYAGAVLAFNLLGWAFLYLVLRLQGVLPWNPQDIPPMSPDLAYNTATSFMTNTNWQAYGGEAQLSYFSQMVGLTVQNFVSAATGMAVAVAVARGFAARATGNLGNFWVDLTRSVLYVLLPLSILVALALAWQGVPQSLSPYTLAQTLEGGEQLIAQGPAASQVAIKQLGTNGGGFFSVNSAHPLENPTILSNIVQCLAILLIPVAFPFLYGRLVGDMRQGVAIFAAMAALFVAGLAVVYGFERLGNPLYGTGVDWAAGNMEGKEQRFGVALSALWATATTAASNGSVNAMHDSFMPLSGLVLLLNIQSGEVVFGGVGAGLYGMIVYVVLAVFLAGLMVGRTPEYLGKKIEAREVKLAMIAFLVMPFGILVFGAFAATVPAALEAVSNPGPHGLSQILYAYSSATGNNGSAFAGYGAAHPFHTTLQGIAMLLGRFLFILPVLAIAGSMAMKTPAPASTGTFPTHGATFVMLLVLTVLILGGLTFFPALALGPIAEHVAIAAGQTF
jgi:K+-transporting ATPase ATPase A chain